MFGFENDTFDFTYQPPPTTFTTSTKAAQLDFTPILFTSIPPPFLAGSPQMDIHIGTNGQDIKRGTPGRNESWFAKEGPDRINTGGGGDKIVDTGIDKVGTIEVDIVYNNTLASEGLKHIGGQVLKNGVFQEFHRYDAGPKDIIRMSAPDYPYFAKTGLDKMMEGKMPGMAVIHGGGNGIDTATQIKSPDLRDGAQQIVMSDYDGVVDDFGWSGTFRQNGDYRLTEFWVETSTRHPANNGQAFIADNLDQLTNHQAIPVTFDLPNTSYSAKREAVTEFIMEGSDGIGHDWLLI